MSIETKGQRNYSAIVIRVPAVRKAENSDRLYVIDALGMTAIVDESWIARQGELALLFPAEVQLSLPFARANNLHRHPALNEDPSVTGYLEDSRRVKALKLRGNISNGLVLPLSSLVGLPYAGPRPEAALSEGDVFDTFRQTEICRKYVIETKTPGLTRGEQQVKKAFKRVDETFLPMHFDTSHWDREEHRIGNGETVIVTQKLHGTSVRLANTVVKRQLTWLEKLAQKLGVAVKDHDYDLVAGSRKVIKDPNNPNQKHHYGSDVWSNALGDFGQKIPKNHIVYGELVGFTPDGGPIQKGHTYECDPNGFMIGEKTQLYVYRVAVVTEDGDLIDLSWNQVKAFCVRHGLKNTPELLRTKKGLLYLPDLEELNFWEEHQADLMDDRPSYNETPVKLSPGGTGKDEGVVIRVETGMVPEFFKFKNKSHYLYESDMLDSGEVDLESQG